MVKQLLKYLFFSAAISLGLNAQELPEGFIIEEFASGLDRPTDLALTDHDGRIFITEKTGAVRIIENGVLLNQPFYQVETETPNERGLLGIALDPNFEENQFVYLYHTIKDQRKNRLIRVTAAGNTALPESEIELFRTDRMWASWHNGGALIFDQSEKILLAIGDGTSGVTSTKPDVLLGVIVRLNRDGSIPEDNPILPGFSQPGPVYAYGVRNPYNMDYSETWEVTYFNDVGNALYEEVNALQAGGDYGWNKVEGYLGNASPPSNDYVDPLHVYEHVEDGLCAIVGAAFYEPEHYTFPPEYHSKYFFMDYCDGIVYYLDPPTAEVKTFATGFDFPNNLAVDHNGDLFIMQLATGQLFRISFGGDGSPIVVSQPKSQTVAVGSTAQFVATVNGSEPLSYQWFFDEAEIGGATSDTLMLRGVTLEQSGAYRYKVSNNLGELDSKQAMLTVVEGSAPQIQIVSAPQSYRAGDTLTFIGMGIDAEDGQIDDGELVWTVEFRHDQHSHPALGPVIGEQATYTVPLVGETDTTVFYRAELMAFDSDGLSGKAVHSVMPQMVSIGLETNPPGVVVGVDGAAIEANGVVRSLERMNRLFEMPRHQIVNEHLLAFNQWFDGASDTLIRLYAAEEGLTVGANFEDLGFYHTASGSELHIDYYIGTGSDTAFYLDHNREAGIDANWDVVSPWRWRGDFPNDGYSVKWMGQIVPPIDATYHFSVLHDGFVTLKIADQTLLDRALDQSEITEPSMASVALSGGAVYDFELFYEHVEFHSRVLLSWSYEVVGEEPVPGCHFQLPNTTTSTEAFELATKFRIYPNPSVDQERTIELISCTPSPASQLLIYSQTGQLLRLQPLTAIRSQLEIDGMPPGVYFAVLEHPAGRHTEKLVILR